MLLIGAGGFVGRHVCEAAANAGLNVVASDRHGHAGPRCDLLDRDSVAAVVAATEPEMVVNMAGAASVAASWGRPEDALAVNAAGTATLLEVVADLAPSAQLLCVSSAEVYGEPSPERLPLREEDSLRPVTPYGESKLAMEVECGRLAAAGLRIAVIRAFNQLGPGQSPAFAASGFARQVAAAELAGEEVAELAVGNLAAARDFTDVRDAARAFVEVSRAGLTGTYNLCSGRALSLEALIAEIAEATPLPLRTVADPSLVRPVDPGLVYGSPQKLRDAIGWVPQIPLSRTVTEMLAWWRAELAAA